MKLICMSCGDKINPNEKYVGFNRPAGYKFMCLRCYKERGGKPNKIRNRVGAGLQSPFPVPEHPRPMPSPRPGRPSMRFRPNKNDDKDEGYSGHEDPFIEEEEGWEDEEEELKPRGIPRDQKAMEVLSEVRERMQAEEEKEAEKLIAEEKILYPEGMKEEIEPEGGWPTLEQEEERIFGTAGKEIQEKMEEQIKEIKYPTDPKKFVVSETPEDEEMIGVPEYKRRGKRVRELQDEFRPEWDEYQHIRKEARWTAIPSELHDKAKIDPECIRPEGWICVAKVFREFRAQERAAEYESYGYMVGLLELEYTGQKLTGEGPEKRGVIYGVFIYDPDHAFEDVSSVQNQEARPRYMSNPKGKRRAESSELLGKSKLGSLSIGMWYKLRDLMNEVIPQIRQDDVGCEKCNPLGLSKNENPKFGIDPDSIVVDEKTGEIISNVKVCPVCKGNGFYKDNITPTIDNVYGPYLLRSSKRGVKLYGPKTGPGYNKDMVYYYGITIAYETLSELERRINELEEYNRYKKEKKKIVYHSLIHKYVEAEEPLNRYVLVPPSNFMAFDLMAKYRCQVCNKDGKQKTEGSKVGLITVTKTFESVDDPEKEFTLDVKCPDCNGEGFTIESVAFNKKEPEFKTERYVGYYRVTTGESRKPLVPVVNLNGIDIVRGPPQETVVGVIDWLIKVGKVPMTTAMRTEYDKATKRVMHPHNKGEDRVRMFGYFYHESMPVEYSITDFWNEKGESIVSELVTIDDDDLSKFSVMKWNDLPEEIRNGIERIPQIVSEVNRYFPKESNSEYWKKHAKEILDYMRLYGDENVVRLLDEDSQTGRFAKTDFDMIPSELKKLFLSRIKEFYKLIPCEMRGFSVWWESISNETRANCIIKVSGFSPQEVAEICATPLNELPPDIMSIVTEAYNEHPKEVFFNFYIESYAGRRTVYCEIKHPIHGISHYKTPDVRYTDQALETFEQDIDNKVKLDNIYTGLSDIASRAFDTLNAEMDVVLSELAGKLGVCQACGTVFEYDKVDICPECGSKEKIKVSAEEIMNHPKRYGLPYTMISYLVTEAIRRHGGLNERIRASLIEKKLVVEEISEKKPKEKKERKHREKSAKKTKVKVDVIPMTYEPGELSFLAPSASQPTTPTEQPKPEQNPIGETIVAGILAGIASGATAGVITSAVTPKANPQKKRRGPAKGSPEAKAKMAKIRKMRKLKTNEVM